MAVLSNILSVTRYADDINAVERVMESSAANILQGDVDAIEHQFHYKWSIPRRKEWLYDMPS